MTENEIVEMARKTLSKDIDGLWLAGTADLEEFAKLVAKKAVNDFIELLREETH